MTHDIEIHSVSVYQMLPHLKLLLIKRNVDIEPASLLGSAHHHSFWVILAQMHYPPCQKWWVLSVSPVFSDQLFPPSHLTLLPKIAKQMGKVEQNIKCEHLFLNSYLNEKFDPFSWLCWDPPQTTRVQELPHLLQQMQRSNCSSQGHWQCVRTRSPCAATSVYFILYSFCKICNFAIRTKFNSEYIIFMWHFRTP